MVINPDSGIICFAFNYLKIAIDHAIQKSTSARIYLRVLCHSGQYTANDIILESLLKLS